jgi:hypothetical protein
MGVGCTGQGCVPAQPSLEQMNARGCYIDAVTPRLMPGVLRIKVLLSGVYGGEAAVRVV